MERHRTGGMTAIAVLTIIFGGLGILNGLFQVLHFLVLMYELLRVGLFEIPVAPLTFSLLSLATGIVGLITGIGMFALRPWARALSLVYGGLLILSSVFSFFTLPIIASIGTYDIGSIGASGLARLIIFSVIYLVLPVLYPLLLCVVFFSPAWKITFAKGRTA
ncbi:hypothetical protein SAMN05444159_0496 [Bradyrhizobium lablabi]|uniref:Uncharacterized protein n=1 Tax=Bradyrhizobium lablabi TaxID=722472 RepID=A0A1M6IXV3_9BRAD|nr:hypothetical protein [Bradyrhizobium lablabi]SHJ39237.1 hypothetical protein SAMN05444159_0496 [Bradyrhizobium lablabi]